MTQLIYPNLDLFIYNLVGVAEEEFWKNFPDGLTVTRNNEPANADYVELLTLGKDSNSTNYCPLPSEDKTTFDYPIQGFYYPVQLGDTYGLLLDCSVEGQFIPRPIACFQELKSIAASKQGNLGKTWLIQAYSTETDPEKLKTLAQEIYTVLMSRNWQHCEQGKFLGGLVFEVPPISQSWQGVVDEGYVLIVLYPNLQVMQRGNEFYPDWMQLFYYRSKTYWVYENAQQLKKPLEKKFFAIEEEIPEIKNLSVEANLSEPNLKLLKTALKKSRHNLYEYATGLSNLEIKLQTVETNLQNYQQCIKNISEKANAIGETDLKFLKRFSDTVRQKYKPQIKSDYTCLSPGLIALENLTHTIRGIVEIEQAERDRRIETQNSNFQKRVAIIGVGVGTAAVAAAAVSPFVEVITQLPSTNTNNGEETIDGWLNFGVGLSISIGVGLLASLIVAGILALTRSRRPRDTK